MNTNASPAMIASPISIAATAIPAIAPVLSPDELCDTVTVPLADAAPAVAVIADEVDIDEDTEEVEEEDEEVLVELGAAADVPGKSLSGMAWNVVSIRGFWQN
jgi:hypothetical protein